MDDLSEMLGKTMAAMDSYGFTRAAEAVERASNELDRLRAENERLKADAARFQWVLAQMRFENERDMGPGRHWRFAFYLPRQDPREDPAAAVDAAMAQGKV